MHLKRARSKRSLLMPMESADDAIDGCLFDGISKEKYVSDGHLVRATLQFSRRSFS
jgi:hypothetical protein